MGYQCAGELDGEIGKKLAEVGREHGADGGR